MSDLNQISKDDLSLINDNLKLISISDEEDDEIIETSIPLIVKEGDDDELLIDLKPRRARRKDEDDEQSEGDDDNQNVPKTKINDTLDDDNNTQSPAYVPRKGKFYEHDDRTLDENQRPKQEISRNKNRVYKDSDGKWQHDLYLRDQRFSKSRQQNPNRSKSVDMHPKPHYNQPRKPRQLNEYVVRSPTAAAAPPPRRQNFETVPRTNNFDFKDPFSYNRNTQKGEFSPYRVDERTFHRRKNFTNTQFQGAPPRLRHLTQKQEYQGIISNASTNIDRPKRYSNMRTNLTNSIQPQTSYQFEQNFWPQAPPPPTSYPPQQATSRYIPFNYSQGSIFEQFQANK